MGMIGYYHIHIVVVMNRNIKIECLSFLKQSRAGGFGDLNGIRIV